MQKRDYSNQIIHYLVQQFCRPRKNVLGFWVCTSLLASALRFMRQIHANIVVADRHQHHTPHGNLIRNFSLHQTKCPFLREFQTNMTMKFIMFKIHSNHGSFKKYLRMLISVQSIAQTPPQSHSSNIVDLSSLRARMTKWSVWLIN